MVETTKTNKSFLIIVVGLVLIVVVGLTFLIWNRIQFSPQYSLFQAYQAVSQKNYAKFAQYVDMDTVVDHVLNQSSEDLSDLRTLSKTLLKRQVENGNFFGSDWIKAKSIIDLASFCRSTKISKVNTLTQAVISKVTNQPIRFNLIKKDNIWKVINIDLELNQVLGLIKDQSGSQALTEEEKKLLHYFELKVLGFMAIKENKLTDGIKALEEVLKIKEDNTLEQYLDEAYFERGEYFYSIKEIQKALDDLSHCSKKNAKAQALLAKINQMK